MSLQLIINAIRLVSIVSKELRLDIPSSTPVSSPRTLTYEEQAKRRQEEREDAIKLKNERMERLIRLDNEQRRWEQKQSEEEKQRAQSNCTKIFGKLLDQGQCKSIKQCQLSDRSKKIVILMVMIFIIASIIILNNTEY